ncbi:hypothetical protein ZWY2020_051049 [Hordeum vulgare]|nr:hypothetical protein ZWY2020_051049 [Hordeum vulgare]
MSSCEAILKEMAQAGFKPNIFILTSLIRCYGKVGCTRPTTGSAAAFYHGRDTPVEELGKVVDCIDRSNAQLGTVVKLLVDRKAFTESFREAARHLSGVRGVVKMPS